MGGEGADVTVYPIRTGDQQTGYACVHRWHNLYTLQSWSTGHAVAVSSDIAVLTHDQCLRYLGVLIKELEQALDHALGMGGVVGVLPEEQCDTQGGGITPVQNISSSTRIFRLLGRGYRKYRDWPIGYRVAG
ncbi:hypothetical protein D3C75_912320 [compost metagenome]